MIRPSVLALLLVSAPALADTSGARWLRERTTLEWMAAAGGWRAALGTDQRAPGFQGLGGGTEVVVALDIWGPLGLALDGRFLGGLENNQKFLEATGGLALQVHLSDSVRLRAGPAAGELYAGDETGVLVGGFVAVSVDLFALGGRVAIAFTLRLDADALLFTSPVAQTHLPDSTVALAIGLGFKY
jgi:hypothetical protein